MPRSSAKFPWYRPSRLAGWLVFSLLWTSGAAAEIDVELARQGQAFLKTYCYKCHGINFRYPGLDMLDRATLLRPNDPKQDPFIVPGQPADSRVWEAIDTAYMPPEKQPQPSAEEKATFRRWIEAGAHFPPEDRPLREFLAEETILKHIADDLLALDEVDVPYTRYFSLAHLWNDTAGLQPTTDEDLRIYRAALSKLLNSLSSAAPIVLPRAIDPQTQTIFAIDLRQLGWSEWHWSRLIRAYPYGLKAHGAQGAKVYRLTDTRIPYVRADWFVFNAARPPLYYDLLAIPNQAPALEASVGVNIHENFERNQLARAAFEESGVSDQNRLVERHDARKTGGYYWKSYDVKPGSGERGDFIRRPLGPKFEDVQGPQLAAFQHDGGEIIWSLANGLQAYMLVDGQDGRIDEGPVAVVSDPNQHSGSFAIVNGISCMGCHSQGMISWEQEDVRPVFEKLRGQAVADKVLKLFPKQDEMQRIVQGDRERFQRGLEAAIGPFVRSGPDDRRTVDQFAEPITKLSRAYQRKLDLETAARELGLAQTIEEGEKLAVKSKVELRVLIGTQLFKDLGLANLTNSTVSREVWEKAYGRVAREFGIGVPIRPN